MSHLQLLQIGSIFLLLVLTWFGALLPTRLSALDGKKRKLALALGNSFSGGVFVCVGLAHLLPDAVENFAPLENISVPIPYFMALAGFLLVFFVENILLGSGSQSEVVAFSQVATDRQQSVDVIVVPRRIIPHFSSVDEDYEDIDSESHRMITGHGTSTQQTGNTGEVSTDDEADRTGEDGKPVGHKHGSFLDFTRAKLEERRRRHVKHEQQHQALLQEAQAAEFEHHHHHHIDVSSGALMPYILALVLSIHSFIEGLALGVQPSVSETIVLLIAIASHKWIEAFAFGASFVKQEVTLRRWVGILLVYSLATPAGITIGLFLSNYLTGDIASIIEGTLEAIAAGTFLYVAIMDILKDEFEHPGPWLKRYSMFACMLIGIAAIGVVLSWDEISKQVMPPTTTTEDAMS